MKKILVGVIASNILDKIRLELNPEDDIKDFFTVLTRKILSNNCTTDDEIFSNRCTAASVKTFGDIFKKLGITNAVNLVINYDIIFADLHGEDNDLDKMIESIDKANIPYLNSAEITMEDSHDCIHYLYTILISKNKDNSVNFTVNIVGKSENDSKINKADFNFEIDKFVDELKNLEIDCK